MIRERKRKAVRYNTEPRALEFSKTLPTKWKCPRGVEYKIRRLIARLGDHKYEDY